MLEGFARPGFLDAEVASYVRGLTRFVEAEGILAGANGPTVLFDGAAT